MKKILFVLCFCLLKISAYSQNKKFNCTKNNNQNSWLLKEYEHFKFWLEDENIQVNNESYWIYGGGGGEVSFSHSALIIPMEQETVIYQDFFTDKQIIKEVITIEYLSKYFKKLNENVESDVVANSKYFAIGVDGIRKDECIKVYYSVNFIPVKNWYNYLIDFTKIIEVMN